MEIITRRRGQEMPDVGEGIGGHRRALQESNSYSTYRLIESLLCVSVKLSLATYQRSLSERIRPMSNYDPNASAPGFSANGATAIDVGLRAFMLRVYNYMAAGVGLTGVAAFLTYQLTGPELLHSPLMWVFMLAPAGLVFFISARINTLSVEAARGLFFLYAAFAGFSL